MRLLLLAPPLLALLLGVACVATEPSNTQDIVSTIPWPDHERAEYVLLDRDGEQERGRGVLTINLTEEGRYSLALHFENDTATDDSTVVVDATTLKPVSVRHEFSGTQNAVIEGEYDAVEDVVRITETQDGDERTVPHRLKDHYYDNDSS